MKFCKTKVINLNKCLPLYISNHFHCDTCAWKFHKGQVFEVNQAGPRGRDFNQTIMHFLRLSHTMMLNMDNEVTKQIKNRDITKCWCGSAENDTWDQTKPWADCGPAPILLLQSIFHSRPVTFTLFTSRFLHTQVLTKEV